ncbi:hypothetical protein VJ923_03060 [Adlercreutzia sp. R25]|uniref:LysR substrate-binding domain-containing protein n=1 Tax=Adlercreutzia shanghongiae TaxID=3111773 RepID=A0ABU6IWC3_9ACTN|nr:MULTISPECIES: hypothetical protein [unclassified Adlercreutzia]MEC4272138.1 hypothetical protein [Adlercreutzia sp. R25]MEC4293859.1 hypothetical protein [Adlercreutzia sp. R22]
MPGHGFKCYQHLLMRMIDEGIESPAIIERSELMWIYEEVARGRAIGFSLPYMNALAAFSCHDNIRPIPLENSSWGFGVVHDKAPAETSHEAAFEQCVIDCARQLMAQEARSRKPPYFKAAATLRAAAVMERSSTSTVMSAYCS